VRNISCLFLEGELAKQLRTSYFQKIFNYLNHALFKWFWSYSIFGKMLLTLQKGDIDDYLLRNLEAKGANLNSNGKVSATSVIYQVPSPLSRFATIYKPHNINLSCQLSHLFLLPPTILALGLLPAFVAPLTVILSLSKLLLFN